MADFLQLFVSGLATGSIYALAGLGFTLLWQASGTINFAQGEFVMLPAFAMLAFAAHGVPLLVGFALTCVLAVVVLGWGFKRGIADPLLQVRPDADRRRDARPVDRAAQRRARRLQRRGAPVPEPVRRRAVPRRRRGDHAGRRRARSPPRSSLVLATQAFLARTVTGRAMQAVAQNADSATVLGHRRPAHDLLHLRDQRRARLRGGAAGHADLPGEVRHGRVARHQGVLRGDDRRLQQLARRAARRAVVGVCENLAAAYVSAAYKDAVALAIFIFVILVKPQGLLGKPVERKV